MKRPFLIFSLYCISLPIFAWDSAGHQLVAQIAYDQLTPQAKNSAQKLIALFNQTYGKRDSFVTVADFPDRLKSRDIHTFDHWHFINRSFSLDKAPLQKVKTPNIVWALQHTKSMLRNPQTPPPQKAWSLVLLIHLMGDIHQPLHAINRVSKRYPDGDQGGNLFLLEKPQTHRQLNKHHKHPNKHPRKKYLPLHLWWDNGLGLFEPFYKKNKLAKKQWIQTLARYCEKQYGQTVSYAAQQTHPNAIADESFQIAANFVYQIPENSTPPIHYQIQGQKIALQQITLAGYRLAYLLNHILQ